ncbi:MAG: hypothetical protein V2I43_28085 [Parvularcula sp.]|jgi:hypothetical protein|nr:hypothetical protein [Parvularcula sp.]
MRALAACVAGLAFSSVAAAQGGTACQGVGSAVLILDPQLAVDRLPDDMRRSIGALVARLGPEGEVAVAVLGRELAEHRLSARPTELAAERAVLTDLVTTRWLRDPPEGLSLEARSAQLETAFAQAGRPAGKCGGLIFLASDLPDPPRNKATWDPPLSLSGYIVLHGAEEAAPGAPSRTEERWRRRVESGGGRWIKASSSAGLASALEAAALAPWREGGGER